MLLRVSLFIVSVEEKWAKELIKPCPLLHSWQQCCISDFRASYFIPYKSSQPLEIKRLTILTIIRHSFNCCWCIKTHRLLWNWVCVYKLTWKVSLKVLAYHTENIKEHYNIKQFCCVQTCWSHGTALQLKKPLSFLLFFNPVLSHDLVTSSSSC